MVKIIQGLNAVLLGRLLLAQKTWDMHQWHLVGSKKMFVSTLCHHFGWKRDFFPQVPRKWFVEDVRNGNYSSRHLRKGGVSSLFAFSIVKPAQIHHSGWAALLVQHPACPDPVHPLHTQSRADSPQNSEIKKQGQEMLRAFIRKLILRGLFLRGSQF